MLCAAGRANVNFLAVASRLKVLERSEELDKKRLGSLFYQYFMDIIIALITVPLQCLLPLAKACAMETLEQLSNLICINKQFHLVG